jgi:hypothetical protein
MGLVTGILGIGGGSSGSGFAKPTGTTITPGTNTAQINNSYYGNQTALGNQQALLAALQGQSGIQNQSSVFNQQQALANTLGSYAAGQGPNPALAQLANTTGQNVANQAALMAGQRGAGANVGLIARQAGQQGAATQQQAVGQAALQSAQQQIAYTQALQQQQAMLGQTAGTQVANQMGATQALTGAQQNEQQILQQALANQNNANVTMQSNINNANAGLAQQQMKGQQGLIGGILGGVSSLLGGAGGGARGGEVGYADGGNVSNLNLPGVSGPRSSLGKFLNGMNSAMTSEDDNDPLRKGMSAFVGGIGNIVGSALRENPLEKGTDFGDSLTNQASMSGMAAKGGSVDFRTGGKVKARNMKEKAVKPGNNYSNDKIPAVLSEHEIVLPRSVTMSADPVKASAQFVAQIVARRNKGKK